MIRPEAEIFKILVVDDSREDATLLKGAFFRAERSGRFPPTSIQFAMSAEELWKQLTDYKFLVHWRRPDVILLDLHMPKVDGYEILKKLKDDPYLRNIPVVIFSGSEDEKDIQKSYQLQATLFVKKPADLDEYQAALTTLYSMKRPSAEDEVLRTQNAQR